MSVDSVLLENLMKYNAEYSPQFTLHLNDALYDILSVTIENSSIPVNEPTTRGGVYFSEKFAYKMKGNIEDLTKITLLQKKCLVLILSLAN